MERSVEKRKQLDTVIDALTDWLTDSLAHWFSNWILLSLVRLVSFHFFFTSYGKGPYYAEFHLQFPESSGATDILVVEFPSRNELPHSVFTLIDLVQAKLYDGTSIVSKRDGALRIGASPPHTARLSQRYKALGYGESALSFIESSPSFACRKHSVGLVGRGPALEIHISDRHVNDQDRTCLGRVVQGMEDDDDVLARVEAAMDKGEVVEIVHVRQIQVPDSASRKEL
jgi:hypothetical protein